MNHLHTSKLGTLQSGITVLLSLSLCTGCATVTTNLQSVSVSGPLHQPAVHLKRTTDQPGFRISPWLTAFSERERLGSIPGHTKVNAAGLYQVDTVAGVDGPVYYENAANVKPYDGQNFTWRLPAVSGGINFDLDVGESASILLGLGMTSVNNVALWSAHAGISYSSGNERVVARLEGALTWETVASSAQFVRRIDFFFSDKTEVQFFSEENKLMRMGGYGALTLQSTGKNFVFYTQFALGTQAIASLSHPGSSSSTDGNDYVRTMKFISVTPGVAFTVGEDLRLITGIRFTGDTEISGTNTPFLIVPLAQLEISF